VTNGASVLPELYVSPWGTLKNKRYNITNTAHIVLKLGLYVESIWGQTFVYLNLKSLNFFEKQGGFKKIRIFTIFKPPNIFTTLEYRFFGNIVDQVIIIHKFLIQKVYFQ